MRVQVLRNVFLRPFTSFISLFIEIIAHFSCNPFVVSGITIKCKHRNSSLIGSRHRGTAGDRITGGKDDRIHIHLYKVLKMSHLNRRIAVGILNDQFYAQLFGLPFQKILNINIKLIRPVQHGHAYRIF